MQLNFGNLLNSLGQLLSLAASLAALVSVLKAVGVSIPQLPGGVEHWAWVAIACAAARHAR